MVIVGGGDSKGAWGGGVTNIEIKTAFWKSNTAEKNLDVYRMDFPIYNFQWSFCHKQRCSYHYIFASQSNKTMNIQGLRQIAKIWGLENLSL